MTCRLDSLQRFPIKFPSSENTSFFALIKWMFFFYTAIPCLAVFCHKAGVYLWWPWWSYRESFPGAELQRRWETQLLCLHRSVALLALQEDTTPLSSVLQPWLRLGLILTLEHKFHPKQPKGPHSNIQPVSLTHTYLLLAAEQCV